MRFEAMAPSHCALAVLGYAREHLVEMSPGIVAHRYHRAVDERDPGTPPEGVHLHEEHQLDKDPRHAPDEAQVVVLERAVRAEMIAYRHRHYLAFRHPPLAASAPASVRVPCGQAQVLCQFCVQILIKFIDDTKNLNNFVLGNHRLFVL